MAKRWTNFEVGQRVEATDAIQLAVDTPVQSIQAVARDLFSGTHSLLQNAVLEGFTVSNPSGTLITVLGGTAILGFRRNGAVQFGMVTSGGATSKSADLTSLADGVYGVYARFEFNETDFANRFFWNPLSATPAETPQNVGTRLSEDWTFTVDLVSPGPEWILLNSITKAGAVLTLSDQRRLFFDTSDGVITNQEWGTTQDRLSPVGNLRDMVMALARMIQDITGNANWRDFPPTDLTTLPTEVILRDGSNTFDTGATLNWADDTGVVGDAEPVDRIQGRQFDGANEFSSNAGAHREVFSAGFLDDQQVGPVRALVNDFTGFNDVGGGVFSSADNEHVRIYASGNGLGGDHVNSLEVAINCAWDEDTSQWRRDRTDDGDATEASTLLVFGGVFGAMTVYRRTSVRADVWTDTENAAAGWELTLQLEQSGRVRASGNVDSSARITASQGYQEIVVEVTADATVSPANAGSHYFVDNGVVSATLTLETGFLPGDRITISAVAGQVRFAVATGTRVNGTLNPVVSAFLTANTSYVLVNVGNDEWIARSWPNI